MFSSTLYFPSKLSKFSKGLKPFGNEFYPETINTQLTTYLKIECREKNKGGGNFLICENITQPQLYATHC